MCLEIPIPCLRRPCGPDNTRSSGDEFRSSPIPGWRFRPHMRDDFVACSDARRNNVSSDVSGRTNDEKLHRSTRAMRLWARRQSAQATQKSAPKRARGNSPL